MATFPLSTLTIFPILMVLLSNVTHSQLVNCKGSTCNCPFTSENSDDLCVLDCDNIDICKESTLTCRSGDACAIFCSAIASCSSGTTINAETATDVTITCSAEDSCKDNMNIICGTGNCKLKCYDTKACLDWGSIDVSLSSSFECIGDCPNNIPSPFSSRLNLPTIQPTQIPTLSPLTYIPIPQETVETKDPTNTAKVKGFDIAIIGVVTMTFSIVIVVIVWLFYMLCNKRKMRRTMLRKKNVSHKRTISDSFPKRCQKNGVFGHHESPSMDLIINSMKTPMRSPILCIKNTTDDGEALYKEIEIELSKTFTVDSVLQHQHTTPSNYDDEDTDDDETDINNTTPPALPGIPDHKPVTQSVNDLISQVKHFENDGRTPVEINKSVRRKIGEGCAD